MLCVGRFVIMNRPETPVTDAAFAAHRPEPGPVAAAQLAVGIARVAHVAHAVHLLTDKKPAHGRQACTPPGTLRGPLQGRGCFAEGTGYKMTPGYKRGPGVGNMEPLAGLEPAS